MKKILWLLTVVIFISIDVNAQADVEKKIQTDLILAEDGDVVNLDGGVFTITKSLSLDGKKNIVIRGKGSTRPSLPSRTRLQAQRGLGSAIAKTLYWKT